MSCILQFIIKCTIVDRAHEYLKRCAASLAKKGLQLAKRSSPEARGGVREPTVLGIPLFKWTTMYPSNSNCKNSSSETLQNILLVSTEKVNHKSISKNKCFFVVTASQKVFSN